jgi:hypothetical protein
VIIINKHGNEEEDQVRVVGNTRTESTATSRAGQKVSGSFRELAD